MPKHKKISSSEHAIRYVKSKYLDKLQLDKMTNTLVIWQNVILK